MIRRCVTDGLQHFFIEGRNRTLCGKDATAMLVIHDRSVGALHAMCEVCEIRRTEIEYRERMGNK